MKSWDFANERHKGQTRINGNPFMDHPNAVANTVRRVMPNAPHLEALVDACNLHDTVEDTPTTFEEIEREFGPTVAMLVYELTSDMDQIKAMGKGPYLLEKMMGMSNDALVIKLADRLNNILDTIQLDRVGNDRHKRFAAKYKAETQFILDGLTRELLPEHQQLRDEIREALKQL